mmetsp:Transcript_2552/g.4644  ORF Transcript_2552/g.4644 Transcript_2552/m.4644 type:complete len:252 (-) Transcript_2552:593-1348(-)
MASITMSSFDGAESTMSPLASGGSSNNGYSSDDNLDNALIAKGEAVLSLTRPELTKDDPTCRERVFQIYTDFMALYCQQPLWVRVFGTIMALVIVVDGAILFFVLIGGFSYLDSEAEATILEWSIQIINVCFTTLCLLELPSRVRNSCSWLGMTSPCTAALSGINADTTTRHDLMKSYNKPVGNEAMRWKLFGLVNLVKVFQIGCQCWVEYLCLAYIGRRRQRPEVQFAVAVGLALPLGCGLGGAEGYLKS